MPDASATPPEENAPAARSAAAEAAAQVLRRRLPSFERARNFRDLGGYPSEAGGHVRWGLLYRSGSLASLTVSDQSRLVAMGVRGVCDLRSTLERAAEPFAWCEPAGRRFYWSRDYHSSFGELRELLSSALPSAAAARAAMFAGYRRLPYEQAPAYRELFSRLVAGEVPLVFNCSAGKDRAGTAAALILRALGVRHEIVEQDYALTATVVDLREMIAKGSARSMLSEMPPGVISAILDSDPEYIQAALDAIDATSGSLETYLREQLGVGAKELCRLRELLLE